VGEGARVKTDEGWTRRMKRGETASPQQYRHPKSVRPGDDTTQQGPPRWADLPAHHPDGTGHVPFDLVPKCRALVEGSEVMVEYKLASDAARKNQARRPL
jgi:hypothetical protein